MHTPDYKSVFLDPASHVDFIRVPEDDTFEGQNFDRKQASRTGAGGALPKSEFQRLKEMVEATMSAFANASGGLLVLGVTKAGEISGLDHLTENQINGLLNLKSMVGAVIQAKLHPIAVGDDTRRIALFSVDVPERSICQRIKDDAAWIRRGLFTQRLRRDELEQLKRDRRVVDFEMTPTETFEHTDIDDSVLAEFARSVEMPGDDRDPIQILRNAGAINGKLWTNAGLLFFAYAFADSPKDLDIVAVVQPGYEQNARDLVTRLLERAPSSQMSQVWD